MNIDQAIERLEEIKEDYLRDVEKAMRQGKSGIVKDYSKSVKAIAYALGALRGLRDAANGDNVDSGYG